MFAALFGTAGVDGQIETAWLWPCNVDTWNHWHAVQTQWRYAMGGGPIGLDYAGVRAYLQEHISKRSTRRRVFAGIRAAERGHLEGCDITAQRRKDRKGAV